MPELPEIETVRRTLTPAIVGRSIWRADLRRPDYVRGEKHPDALLVGDTVARIDRHGKQLALVGATGRCLCVHLGMSGQIRLVRGDRGESREKLTHSHLVWFLKGRRPSQSVTVVFRDPRRFGGIWTFPSTEQLLRERWSKLGPDALSITHDELARKLATTRRCVKAALLDQHVIAGLGNIYIDEALHRAGVRPTVPANSLSARRTRRLIEAIRETLDNAIESGGSTFRDYRDAAGARGKYLDQRLVYGRGGEPCRRCGRRLRKAVVAQRTSVWCSRCQRA